MRAFHSLFLLTTLALSTSAFSVSSRTPYIIHESRAAPPTGWAPTRRALPSTRLPLRIALTQPNLAQLDEYLLDVAHPESNNYGQHWTPARVADTFRPSPDAIDAVLSWLADEGFGPERARLSKSGGWVEASVSVAEAERLLGTEYYVYEHEDGGEYLACAERYHLPEHIAPHVDLVMPTLHFDAKPRGVHGLRKRSGKTPTVASPKVVAVVDMIQTEITDCDQAITPDCIRALYNFNYTPVVPWNNTIGIVEYTPQAYLAADLDLFFANYSPSQVGTRPTQISIDGGYQQTSIEGSSVNAEPALDLQYAMALVGPTQNVTLYQVGDFYQDNSFNNFLDALDASYCTYDGGDNITIDGEYPDPDPSGYQGHDCGTASVSNVISTSYSYTEAQLGSAYTQRQCYEYGKLGLLGVTFLYSSGDTGVSGDGLCLDASGNEGASTSNYRFDPSFPGTCPYVTSVGATQIVPGNTVYDQEIACNTTIYSGGGFSNVFGQPSWQASAVQNYLTTYPPSYASDVFNASGRAYPDLSANGLNYTIFVDGAATLVAGTSASTPVVASVLSAINDARIALGKNPIGFINPTIYTDAFQAAFNDITVGNNPGCNTDGFSAEPGWDPVTGVGTPDFSKLLALWTALP